MPKTDSTNLAPNDLYQKFFIKMEEFKSLPVSDWKTNQLIGYFCDKYYKLYNKPYKFKCNTPQPSKCYEVFNMNSIGYIISKDSQILKDYIDWVFDTQVIKRKRKITVLGFLRNEEFMNEFKRLTLQGPDLKIERSTELPADIIKVISFFITNKQIKTFGDLAFLKQMDSDPTISKLFTKLSEVGFNVSLLDEVV